jgi:hypothetical protein
MTWIYVISIILFIGTQLSLYYERKNTRNSGYYQGMTFVLGMTLTLVFCFGIAIGHFI